MKFKLKRIKADYEQCINFMMAVKNANFKEFLYVSQVSWAELAPTLAKEVFEKELCQQVLNKRVLLCTKAQEAVSLPALPSPTSNPDSTLASPTSNPDSALPSPTSTTTTSTASFASALWGEYRSSDVQAREDDDVSMVSADSSSLRLGLYPEMNQTLDDINEPAPEPTVSPSEPSVSTEPSVPAVRGAKKVSRKSLASS